MTKPILYSFRRCPYCIRARMALAKSAVDYEIREIHLKKKPQEMLDISPKGTVPVLQLTDGTVIDESVDVMYWAMERNDPDKWLAHDRNAVDTFIKECDTVFARAVTRYKYPERFDDKTPETGRIESMMFLSKLEEKFAKDGYVIGTSVSLADIAIMPLIRQFSKVNSDWFNAQENLFHVRKWLTSFQKTKSFDRVMEKHPLWKPE